MAWGFGSFAVLALLMRYCLYPRLRKGMDARYEVIKGGHEQAEQVTDAARADVAQYEAQLATIKAEAQQRIEAARAVLDGERSERLAEVNTRIGEKRAAAATAVEQARTAAQADVEAAVRSVAVEGRRAGHRPDADARRRQRRRRRRHERRGQPMIAAVNASSPGCSSPPRSTRRRSTTRATSRRSSWIWPEQAELIYGTLASVIIIGLLVWKAGPLAKKAFAARTDAGPGRARRRRPRPRPTPTPTPPASARRSATSTASASACSPTPTPRPSSCSPTAGPAWRPRSPTSRPRPTPTSPSAAGRTSDELRGEIARLAVGRRRPRRRALARRRHPAAPHRGLHRQGRRIAGANA